MLCLWPLVGGLLLPRTAHYGRSGPIVLSQPPSFVTDAATIAAPSVAFLEAGDAIIGSACAVEAEDGTTYLLGSCSALAGSQASSVAAKIDGTLHDVKIVGKAPEVDLALLTLPKSAKARGVGMRVAAPKGLHVAAATRAAKSSSGILRQTAKGTIGGQAATAPGTASDPWKNPSRKDTCPIKGACAPK